MTFLLNYVKDIITDFQHYLNSSSPKRRRWLMFVRLWPRHLHAMRDSPTVPRPLLSPVIHIPAIPMITQWHNVTSLQPSHPVERPALLTKPDNSSKKRITQDSLKTSSSVRLENRRYLLHAFLAAHPACAVRLDDENTNPDQPP